MHGLNLPRHGVVTAFACDNSGIGFTQSGMPAKAVRMQHKANGAAS